jgi:hypothetical protein
VPLLARQQCLAANNSASPRRHAKIDRMSSGPHDTPRPRHRFRFGLRTLFIAVTILCCWLGWKVNAARKQREAVAAIGRYGSGGLRHLLYDYQDSPNFKRPQEPHWLADQIGVDFVHDVVSVGAADVTREVFPHLANLPKLHYLSIASADFGDEDCDFLIGLTNLKHLNIEAKALTDAGLSKLCTLQKLEFLSLDYCQISDAGWAHLKELPHLKTLYLTGIPIHDEGLDHLAALPSLKRLYFIETNVTKTSLKQFKEQRLQEQRPDIRIWWSTTPGETTSIDW